MMKGCHMSKVQEVLYLKRALTRLHPREAVCPRRQ